MILPPPLRPGDLVAVIAPSSPFDAALGWKGLGFLRERYRLRFDRGIFARSGYLAGDDARRSAELEAALRDPEVRVILAARGGYGASRFAHSLPWRALAENPRWIVGFSDVTALHVEASNVGIASLHASHLTALGVSHARTRAAFIEALESPGRTRVFGGLTQIFGGQAEGVIVGGNLTMLHACAAAGRLSIPRGAILFIEDVGERPYRIDRMLTTLVVGGHLDGVAGVAVGDFTDCASGPDGVGVSDVLERTLGSLRVPVVRGLPCGHGVVNEPLVLGARARITEREGAPVLVVGGAGD